MSNPKIHGFLLFSSGIFDTNHNVIQICSQKDKQDYETITKLINLQII
jgi:hypothetical protein